MFESCKDEIQLNDKMKELLCENLNELDNEINDFDLVEDVEPVLKNIENLSHTFKILALQYRTKKAEFESKSDKDSQENYNDFNYGFLLGMFFAEVMRDK